LKQSNGGGKLRNKGYFPRMCCINQEIFPKIIFSVWIISIFAVIYLSLEPGLKFPINFWNADKVYHMLAYGWLSALPFWVFRRQKTAVIVALWLILLGVALEYAQAYSPGRICSIWDAVANSGGVALGILFRCIFLTVIYPTSSRSKPVT
jgi:VanZ family protein